MNRPLRGIGRFIAKGCWLALACLTFIVFIFGSTNVYRTYSYICTPVRKPDCAPLENLQLTWLSQSGLALYSLATVLIIAIPWMVMGWLVFLRKSDSVAELFMSLGLATGWATDLCNNNIRFHFIDEMARWPTLTPLNMAASYLVSFVSQVTAVVMAHLIPDGQFVSPWSSWFALIWILQTAVNTLYRYPFEWFQESGVVDLLDQGFAVIAPLSAVLIIWFRYRFIAEKLSKMQLKAILPSALTLLSVYSLFTAWFNVIWSDQYADASTLRFASHFIQSGIQSACAAWFGLSLGSAILRYNFFSTNLVLGRALVYGGLTLGLLAVYLLVVFGLGALLGVTENFWLSLGATALTTVLFQPLRERLKRRVDRLLYGGRNTPSKMFTSLSQQLHPTFELRELLPNVVRMIGRQLELPYVGIISCSQQGKTEARAGTSGLEVKRFPLAVQNESLGWLEVSLPPGEVFDAEEYRFLEVLAEHVAMIVKSSQLTAELQTVRQQLVTTREDERRSLQRDLHDGLGPALGAQSLIVGSARRLLKTDPHGAERLLGKLESDMHGTLEQVRRLVYRLRPPELDQLGLAGALPPKLKEVVGEQVRLELILPDASISYPAAVEVAAYHIVMEAVSNVVRHAHAEVCKVELRVSETALEIVVSDDGKGFTHERHGVGLAAIRERTEELGGTFSVTSSYPGVQVQASLPLFGVEGRTRAGNEI